MVENGEAPLNFIKNLFPNHRPAMLCGIETRASSRVNTVSGYTFRMNIYPFSSPQNCKIDFNNQFPIKFRELCNTH